jgi:hypothetical protein
MEAINLLGNRRQKRSDLIILFKSISFVKTLHHYQAQLMLYLFHIFV